MAVQTPKAALTSFFPTVPATDGYSSKTQTSSSGYGRIEAAVGADVRDLTMRHSRSARLPHRSDERACSLTARADLFPASSFQFFSSSLLPGEPALMSELSYKFFLPQPSPALPLRTFIPLCSSSTTLVTPPFPPAAVLASKSNPISRCPN